MAFGEHRWVHFPVGLVELIGLSNPEIMQAIQLLHGHRPKALQMLREQVSMQLAVPQDAILAERFSLAPRVVISYPITSLLQG